MKTLQALRQRGKSVVLYPYVEITPVLGEHWQGLTLGVLISVVIFCVQAGRALVSSDARGAYRNLPLWECHGGRRVAHRARTASIGARLYGGRGTFGSGHLCMPNHGIAPDVWTRSASSYRRRCMAHWTIEYSALRTVDSNTTCSPHKGAF